MKQRWGLGVVLIWLLLSKPFWWSYFHILKLVSLDKGKKMAK